MHSHPQPSRSGGSVAAMQVAFSISVWVPLPALHPCICAPKPAWAELTSHSSPEHKTNRDPPQIQKWTRSWPHCFAYSLSKVLLNSSHAQRLLDRSKGYSHLCVPTFPSITAGAQPQAGVRCFSCCALQVRAVSPSPCGQHTRSSIPTSAHLLDPWADLTRPKPSFSPDDLSVPKRQWPAKAKRQPFSLLWYPTCLQWCKMHIHI